MQVVHNFLSEVVHNLNACMREREYGNSTQQHRQLTRKARKVISLCFLEQESEGFSLILQ